MFRRLPTAWIASCVLLSCACSKGEPTSAVAARSADAPRPAQQSVGTNIRIGVAASLRTTFEELAHDFEARHPGTTVRLESGASNVLCRKAVDLGAPFDILVLADASLFGELLEPAWTEHHVLLASDRLVVARSAYASGAERIRTANLGEVLLGEGTRLGMADPDRAPLGYRTLIAMQLLERHEQRTGLADGLRAKVGERFVWPDAAALLAHLQSGELDYAFVYAASARDAGLSFTELPEDVNLGSLDHADQYATASVSIVGLTPGSKLVRKGEPIAYGAALATTATNDASKAEFMAEIIGARGAHALANHGFPSLAGDSRRFIGQVPASVLSALHVQEGQRKP